MISFASLRAHRLANTQFALFASLSSVTAGNVVFHLLAARGLGPASYGSLSALLTILLGVAIPAGALEVQLTAQVVENRRRGRSVDHGPLCLRFAQIGLVGAAVMTMGAPALGRFLHITNLLDVMLLGAFLVPSLVGIVLRSVLLGSTRYRELAVSLMAGNVMRVGFGAALVWFGGTMTTALIGTIASEVTAVSAMAIFASRESSPGLAWRLVVHLGDTVGGSSAFTGLWLVAGIDTVLVRHHLDPVGAGTYAAAALAARTVLFLPQAAITSSLPGLSEPNAKARNLLSDLLLWTLVLGLATTLILITATPVLAPVLLGPNFLIDHGVLLMLSGAALWFGILTALVNYHLAQGNVRLANRVWLGCAVLALSTWLVDPTPRNIALSVLSSGIVSSVFVAAPLLRVRTSQLRHHGTGPRPDASTQLSVVLPFLNEGDRPSQTIARLLEAADEWEIDLEVLAISDGSTDGSEDAIHALEDHRIRVIRHDINRGKGAALRTGMTLATGRNIAMLDGDGDIHPRDLLRMVTYIETIECDAVIGSKRHPFAQSSGRLLSRRAMTFSLSVVARILLGSTIPDSQVGAKVFRRDLIVDVLPLTSETGFLLDLELLVLARAIGHGHFVEAPVTIQPDSCSTLDLRRTARAAVDTMQLLFRLGAPSRRNDSEIPTNVATSTDLRAAT